MEPISLLVSLVGLTMQFKQSHIDKKDRNISYYLEWLRKRNHQEIIDIIVSTEELSKNINHVLRSDNEKMNIEIADINAKLSAILLGLDGWSAIVKSLASSPPLSEGAQSILLQAVASGATSMQTMYHRVGGFTFILADKGDIQVAYPRFILEDMSALQEHGYVHQVDSGKDYSRYNITRAGEAFAAKQIGSSS